MTDRVILRLKGCKPEPLASYLKGLAILRLVSEQKDHTVRGWWEDEVFCLKSSLDEKTLVKFLIHEYMPTPIVAPWNGGSGFYPNDCKKGIDALKTSEHPRFSNYKQTIELAEEILESLDINRPPSGSSQKIIKYKLLAECRQKLSDESLSWIDAAYVVTSEGVQFPPLLGTGGNDGRLEFTNNFMQRLTEMIDPDSRQATDNSILLCQAAISSLPTAGLQNDLPIGQFLPGLAGGANAGPGYDAKSLINPWDFILLMEGALLFGTAVSRKLQVVDPGVLSAPFTVRPSIAGYTSVAPEDKVRAEMWVPLWQRPASLREVRMLFSEGRSQVGRRPSRDGVDFARAVATLGVDRGISMFCRIGFIERNGQAHLATPLGSWPVRTRPEVDLIQNLDQWLVRFRGVARGLRSPASLGLSLRKIDAAILDVCRDTSPIQWQRLIMALGEAERQMVKSPQTTKGNRLYPLPFLKPEWLKQADDGSPEFRLAASLSSIYDMKLGPLRANMVPLDLGRYYPTFKLDKMDDNTVVWGTGKLIDNLLLALQRRLLEYRQSELEELPLKGKQPADLEDIRLFIEGTIDEAKLERLLWGLNAINWREAEPLPILSLSDKLPLPAAYAILKLAHLPGQIKFNWKEAGVNVPLDPTIMARARTGQIAVACRLASRRLLASGLVPKAVQFRFSSEMGKRVAAAIAYPLRDTDIFHLTRMVLKAPSSSGN